MRGLLITSTFPTPDSPARGAFNLEMVRALEPQLPLSVIAPVPWTARRPSQRAWRTAGGTRVSHPTFCYPPRVWRSRYGDFYFRSLAATLRRETRDLPPDVVFGYWTHPDSEAAARAARRLNARFVALVGGSDIRLLTRHPARRLRIVRVLREADRVVAFSRDLRQRIVELGVPGNRVTVVYRGVDRDRFRPGDAGAARRRLGLTDDRRLLVWLGRLEPVKNPSLLIEACRRLPPQSRQALQVVILGSGSLARTLDAAIQRHGLSDVVQRRPAVSPEALTDWYQAADRCVLTSDSEGVPNVLLEALACGTALLATRVGGVAEIASPPRDLLFDRGDVETLSRLLDACAQGHYDAVSQRGRFVPEGRDAYGRRLLEACSVNDVPRVGAGHPATVEALAAAPLALPGDALTGHSVPAGSFARP